MFYFLFHLLLCYFSERIYRDERLFKKKKISGDFENFTGQIFDIFKEATEILSPKQ